jgi:microcystin degradation protein MlrC
VAQGANATYTISVTNSSGPDSAAAVETEFVVDSNFTAVSITPSTGSCSGITTITCSLGTVAVLDAPTVTIVLNAKTVPVLTSNLLTSHSVTVTSGTIDNNSGNDTAGVFTTVTP